MISCSSINTHNGIKVPVRKKKKSIAEKLYDMYEHRILEHPNTFYGALMHMVKSSLGTGILAIPLAFKNAGLMVGLVLTILAGLLMLHTVQILIEASHHMSTLTRVPSMGFSDTAEAVFKHGPKPFRRWSTFARLFVDIGMALTYLSGNGVYIVFIGDSLEQITHYFFPNYNIPSIWLILIVTALLIFFCQIRHLKFLVPFSVIANITMLTAFGITFFYMFKRIPDVNVKDLYLARDIRGAIKFLSTIVFCLEGIGTLLPLENSMQKPQFLGCPGVLSIGVSFLMITYSTVGFFGYYAFGEDTKASITYNLNGDGISMVGTICIVIAIFFTYMLQFYVPMEITWRNVSPYVPIKYENTFQIVYRTVAVILVTILAIVIPDLSTIIDIVGSVFMSTLGLFVPCALNTLLNWDKGLGKFRWKLYKNLCIMTLSLFILCSGIYFSLDSLLHPEKKDSPKS
ncbi:hypothetical protein WA026_009354 [Henosepilachna vigintioctopunctata]|uniref:Amino acid transporter transmembrane domain-containing protein n=1 Tax=Henosepilachna vigintioctopunctata TaxID=420089 RepID=A0AAW1TVF4_9CUCU